MSIEQLDELAIPQIQIVAVFIPGTLQRENAVIVTTPMQVTPNEH